MGEGGVACDGWMDDLAMYPSVHPSKRDVTTKIPH